MKQHWKCSFPFKARREFGAGCRREGAVKGDSQQNPQGPNQEGVLATEMQLLSLVRSSKLQDVVDLLGY